jgi:hypothetical protein
MTVAAKEIMSIDDLSADKAPAIFGHSSLGSFVELARSEVASEVPDLTTDKGRKRIASLAAQVSRSKVAVETHGRAYLKTIKELPKKIEAELRDFVIEMDDLRDTTRKPLTDWENDEKARVSGLKSIVAWLESFAVDLDAYCMEQLAAKADELAQYVVGPELQEFEVDASRAWIASTAALKAAIAKRAEADAAAAELARVTAELAERDRKDNEARIAREATEAAEARAETERQAAAKREGDLRREADDARHLAERAANDLIAASEQAERDRIEREEQAERDKEAAATAAERNRVAAEQQAIQERADAAQRQAQAVELAAQAARQRQADEQEQLEREAKAREADDAHRSAVLGAAKVALMKAGITEEQAKAAINLIRRGLVPAVAITY